MAVADDRQGGCDGCGRTVPVEELTAVTMPDDDTVAVCPRCEPHAREAARKSLSLDQRRDACDGCTGTFLESELEDVVLADGAVVTCCPSCRSEAPSENDGPGGSDGPTEDTDGDGSSGGDTLCTQCREWAEVELYRVTTIDGRTERFCPSCKASAEEDGIVKSVEMRATEAREVLGVEDGASDAELRRAFHAQIKRAHPDQDSGSRSAFKLVQEAYDRLRESQ